MPTEIDDPKYLALITVVAGRSIMVARSDNNETEFVTVADRAVCETEQYQAKDVVVLGLKEGTSDVTLWGSGDIPERYLVRVVPQNGLPSDFELEDLATRVAAISGVSGLSIRADIEHASVIATGKVAFPRRAEVKALLAEIPSARLTDLMTLTYPAADLATLADQLNTPVLRDPIVLTPEALETGRLIATGKAPAARKAAVLQQLANNNIGAGLVIDRITEIIG